jgi:hypothetical protein
VVDSHWFCGRPKPLVHVVAAGGRGKPLWNLVVELPRSSACWVAGRQPPSTAVGCSWSRLQMYVHVQ